MEVVTAAEEQTAVEAAYRANFPALVRVAYLMVGSWEVAEDVVQDVFVRAAPHLPGVEHAPSYLRVAVVNACRRHHRVLNRVPKRSAAPTEHAPPGPEGVDLRDALQSLDPRKRAAVVLRYYADLSHDDVAAALGCRPATARSLVHRALRELEEALRDRA